MKSTLKKTLLLEFLFSHTHYCKRKSDKSFFLASFAKFFKTVFFSKTHPADHFRRVPKEENKERIRTL